MEREREGEWEGGDVKEEGQTILFFSQSNKNTEEERHTASPGRVSGNLQTFSVSFFPTQQPFGR
jgi:hypothetical protein